MERVSGLLIDTRGMYWERWEAYWSCAFKRSLASVLSLGHFQNTQPASSARLQMKQTRSFGLSRAGTFPRRNYTGRHSSCHLTSLLLSISNMPTTPKTPTTCHPPHHLSSSSSTPHLPTPPIKTPNHHDRRTHIPHPSHPPNEPLRAKLPRPPPLHLLLLLLLPCPSCYSCLIISPLPPPRPRRRRTPQLARRRSQRSRAHLLRDQVAGRLYQRIGCGSGDVGWDVEE